MSVDSRIVVSLVLTLVFGSVFLAAASAVNFKIVDLREASLSSRLLRVESEVFELDGVNDSVFLDELEVVYNDLGLFGNDLREYYKSGLISEQFYKEKEERLTTLSVLLTKIVSERSDKLVVYDFCLNGLVVCEYQAFVLNYLAKKYEDELFVVFFEVDSSHPLIKLVGEKYDLIDLPLLVVNGKGFNGLKDAKTLEEILLENFKKLK